MPFVTVASNGGPHDDASYVAGFNMGVALERLRHVVGDYHVEVIDRANLPQVDLFAADLGWTLEELPMPQPLVDGWDRWVRVLLRRQTGEVVSHG